MTLVKKSTLTQQEALDESTKLRKKGWHFKEDKKFVSPDSECFIFYQKEGSDKCLSKFEEPYSLVSITRIFTQKRTGYIFPGIPGIT